MSTPPPLPPIPLSRHRTRTQELCGQLHEMAQRLGPDAQMPKLIELCKQLGASQHTLVRAIQELERQEVLYSVRSVGIFVKPQVRRNVRLLCDANWFLSGSTPFWSILLEAARHRALSHREEFSVQPIMRSNEGTAAAQKVLTEEMRGGRVDAVVVVGVEHELTQWMVESGVPIASFACYSPHMVAIDHNEMVRIGVDDLAARGCQDIGLWMLPMHREAEEECVVGFKERVVQAGRTVHSIRIAEVQPKNPEQMFPSRQEEGYKEALSLFDSPQRPDGLVILNDHLAHGALIALDKLGLKAGRDIHIATQANVGSPMLLGREDQVTRLEIEPIEIVEALFSLLEAQIKGVPGTPSCIDIMPRLRLAGEMF